MENKLSKVTDTDDEEVEVEEELMDKEVYKAAIEGNTSIFFTNNVCDDEYLLRKTPQNNHVIHVAVRHERLEFIQEAVKRFPKLICDANCDGDNPLHLAAQIGNLNIMELLVDSYKLEGVKPWRVKNKEGNTPLHVALIYGNIKVAVFLVEEDGAKLSRISNNSKETPLHLAIQYHVDDDRKALKAAGKLLFKNLFGPSFTNSKCCFEKDSMCVIELLLQKARSVACWRDIQGLTPIFRAAMHNPPYVPAIKAILEHCPESTEVCDASGKTFLHLLNKLPSWLDYKDLLNENPDVEALKNIRDKEGNTPTHIALQNQDMDMLLVLLKSRVNLAIRNKHGLSVADLIQQQSDHFWERCKAEEQNYEKLAEDEAGPELSEDEMNAIREVNVTFLRERICHDGSSVLHKRTANGLNILHLIYDQHSFGNFDKDQKEFIQQIPEASPVLMCQIDIKGRNPLHAVANWNPEVVNRSLLEKLRQDYPKIEAKASTIQQLCYDPPWKANDNYGYTPLRYAMSSPEARFMKCAREMLEFDQDLAIQVDNFGKTPLHMLCQSFAESLVPEDMMGDIEAIVRLSVAAIKIKDDEGLVPLLRAAKVKNLHLINLIFRTDSMWHWFELREPDGNTLWHYLADMNITQQTRHILFEECDLFMFFKLIDPNTDENTPLHLAIKDGNFKMAHIFNQLLMEKLVQSGYPNLEFLLKKRNKEGKTPLHLAAGRSEHIFAEEFIQHVADNTCHLGDVLGVCDNEGNSPLHEAMLKKDLNLVKMLFQRATNKGQQDEVLKVANKEGNTLLHKAILNKDYDLAKMFIKSVAIKGKQDEILNIPNNEGNTPLHLVILQREFNLVQFFIQSAITKKVHDQLLNMPNKKGETPNDLIGSEQHLTPEFEEFIWSGQEIVDSMVGVRSLTGVSTTIIKEYTNTLAVVAALLATITFTVAFTTPGGLNNNNGTPLLMKKMAFQVFMISDILAMCLSMMVLFCLLWIMTINTKKDQVMLLDVTVFSLEAAFYATLLTFMMGLYVTVFPITQWIAILTCALCSLLIILMHKHIIIRLIHYLFQIYACFRNLFGKVYTLYRKSCGFIENYCRIKRQNNEERSINLSQANDQEVTMRML